MNPEFQYPPQAPQQPSQPGQFPGAAPGQPAQAPQPTQFAAAPQPVATPQPATGPYPPASQLPVQPVHHNYARKWVIMTFVFIFTTLSVTIAGVWLYMNYRDAKDNVDSKVSTARADADKERADKDAADFLEKEKQPNRQFVGPDDYGRLAFDYPKTWSVYEAKNASTNGGTYEVYFNPGVVPLVASNQQYALHVTIEQKDYDKVVDSYKSQVSKGDLKASSIKVGDQTGTRLDGSFTKDIRGSAIIFKIRDKTVTMRSDAATFTDDFNKLITTITFNK